MNQKYPNNNKCNQWDQLFIENDTFQFMLNGKVKINLYKDSILSNLIFRGFEKEETEFISTYVKKGDIVIDIGANIGLYTLLAAKKTGKTGKVISFEPTPEIFFRLEENIKGNNFTNIDSRNIGLSHKKDNLIFFVSNNGYDAWNSLAPSKDSKLQNRIKIDVSTLDIELKEVDKSKITFVKLDVEGWEKFVILGGTEFFTNYSPLVMVEFTEKNTLNAGYHVHELYDIMIDLGYKWYRIENRVLISEEKKINYPYVNLFAKK